MVAGAAAAERRSVSRTMRGAHRVLQTQRGVTLFARVTVELEQARTTSIDLPDMGPHGDADWAHAAEVGARYALREIGSHARVRVTEVAGTSVDTTSTTASFEAFRAARAVMTVITSG